MNEGRIFGAYTEIFDRVNEAATHVTVTGDNCA